MSKQNNLININKGVKTLNNTITSVFKNFISSYQSVSIFMFALGILIGLSSFQKGGPIGQLIYGLLTWAFGYGVYAIPLLMFYGAAILIRDKEVVKAQKVFVGTLWVQIFSSSLFHFYIHSEPLSISVGSKILQKSGGFVSAFIVFPLNNLLDQQMTHAVLLLGLVVSVLYMTDIELKDLIGGAQAILIYIYKFIFAFFKARREASKINFDVLLTEEIQDELEDKEEINDNVLELKTKSQKTKLLNKKEPKVEKKSNNKSKQSNKYTLPPLKLL